MAEKENKEQEMRDRIVAVSAEYIEKIRKQNVVLWVLIVFAASSFTLQFAILARLSTDIKGIIEVNNQVLTSNVSTLEERIQDRDKTIRQQKDVIDQSVAAILKLAKQVKDLGGDPGEITIKPSEE